MRTSFTYDQALDYLYGLLKFGIKFGLDRSAELCRRMGNPQDSLRAIHVGGTNGKGSTCAFIASILRAAGCSVGTYLSPYVYDVRERIQVNGEPIPEDDFAALVSEIAPHIEAVADTDLGHGTEFEAKTLMAFLYLARRNVDFAVVEVGMGGRYDATNLVRPLVAVVTNVGLDHTERLGDTIQQIAWDKAGIAKAGAPLVTAADAECGMRSGEGEPEEAWRTICATAREQGVGEIWRVIRDGCEPPVGSPPADRLVRFSGQDGKVMVNMPDLRVGPVPLRLAGDFQYANAATAAAAVAAIPRSAFHVPHSAFDQGLCSAYLPGRLEVLRHRPTVVIDAAHNPDAAEKLVESVRRLFGWRRLVLVIGMLSTHSAEGVLAALAPLADEVIATAPQWEKARAASEVAEAARRANPKAPARVVNPVPAAVRAALDSASPDDLVLVTGSFYTIGEVDRAALQEGETTGGR